MMYYSIRYTIVYRETNKWQIMRKHRQETLPIIRKGLLVLRVLL